MTIGIVALSFAKYSEEKEPNPVNKKLGEVTENLVDDIESYREQTVVVTQWEIDRQLGEGNPISDRVVTQDDATTKVNGRLYLDSADVVKVATELFREKGVTQVIVVANKFVHLQLVQRMFEKEGFTVVKHYKIPWVGFDPSPQNLQWWCKGPVRFVIYLGLQVFGKLIGRDFHGIGERSPT